MSFATRSQIRTTALVSSGKKEVLLPQSGRKDALTVANSGGQYHHIHIYPYSVTCVSVARHRGAALGRAVHQTGREQKRENQEIHRNPASPPTRLSHENYLQKDLQRAPAAFRRRYPIR